MVEIQLGSSDMTQSIAANEIVNAYRMMPGPLITLKRVLLSRSGGEFCSLDQRDSRYERRFQMAKYRKARRIKPCQFRYPSFTNWFFARCSRMVGFSIASSGIAHG